MADNTDEEHLVNPTNTQSEISPNETSSTKDTETISPNQELEIMETHAQELHKAPGHGLKHYLFEFLMLFLAVFCGFLAENYRETLVNKEKELHYIQNIVADLKSDTSDLNFDIYYQQLWTIIWTVLCKSQLNVLGILILKTLSFIISFHIIAGCNPFSKMIIP